MTTMTAPSPRTTKRKAEAGRGITPEDLLRYHFVSDPQISPEGRHVVFVKKHVGEKNDYITNLWLVSRAGTAGRNSSVWGEARQFTNGGKDMSPRWSPDGSRIAFIGARDKHKPQVFAMSAEGGEATALTELPEGSIGAMKWSPDGQFIAISFRAQDPQWTQDAKKQREEKGLSDPPRVLDHWWYRLDGDGYFNGQRYQLYLVDAETGEHRVLYTKDTLGFFTFDFSPDSKQMIIGSNTERRAGLKPWNDTLLRLNIATGKTTAVPGLPRGPKDSAKWSPDGKWIAYAGREGGVDGTYSTENLELWICDPVKGNGRSLTGGEDYCLMGAPISDTADVAFAPIFEWSPDSQRIYMLLGWHGEQHLA